jgi:hypothetical protein
MKRPIPRRPQTTIGGEMRHADYPNVQARWIFLAIMEEEYPACVEELRVMAGNLSTIPEATRAEQVDERLVPWCERWHVDRWGWLAQHAHHSIERWARYPDLASMVSWGDLACSVRNPYPLEGWTPSVETERQFRRRIDAYVVDVVARERESGAEPVTPRRGPDPTRHLRWLVLHLIGGMTLADISERFGGDLDLAELSRGIKDARRQLDLR